MTGNSTNQQDHARLAEFVLFSQREFLLNLSKELSRDNISFAQFFLLGHLSSSQEMTMTDIAKKMGHSTAAATGLVDRLEKLGYMECIHAIDDRRKVMVRITPSGNELITRLRGELENQIASAMQDADTPDVMSFLSTFRSGQDAVMAN
jgi:DNA-binding MarR family transcriptional regulator